MKKLIFICLTLALTVTLACGCAKKNPVEKKNDKIEATTSENGEEQKSDEKQDAVAFKNAHLEEALKSALGKDVLSEDDITSVKYLAIGPDSDTKYSLYVGLSDYTDAYYAELQKTDASVESLAKYVKTSAIQCDESDVYDDFAKFTNIEIFEYYNIPISDVSFIKSYENLTYGYFNTNGITDVSCLSDFAPKNLRELDFTGNSIADWKPLEHIKDKVIVLYTTQEVKNEDGTTTVVPKNIMLSDFIDGGEKVDEDAQSDIDEQLKQQSNDIDWSILFGDEAEKK